MSKDTTKKMIRILFVFLKFMLLGQCKEYINQFYTSEQTIVHEQYGLALVPTNIIASSSNTIFQSVFLKVAIPKPPIKPCDIPCAPKLQQLKEVISKGKDCWVENLVFPQTTIIDSSKSVSKEECLAECLKAKCKSITYTDENKECTLRDGRFWSLSARDNRLQTASARMECFLENTGVTVHSLCGNENPISEMLVESLITYRDKMWENMIIRFNDVYSSYDLNLTKSRGKESGRQKRSVDSFLESIPIIGHFYGILKSPIENKKLKIHLRHLETNFQKFSKQVITRLNKDKEFQGEVLKLFVKETSTIYKRLNSLSCDVNSITVIQLWDTLLRQHENKLNEMLSGINKGELKSRTVPLLTAADIMTVVQNNPVFKDTLYEFMPELMLRIGDLILVGITKTEEAFTFNLVLATPRLKKGSLHQVYSPLLVPIRAEAQSCLKLALPNTIFKVRKNYFTADITECEEKNGVILCFQDLENPYSPSITALKCLDGDFESCPTISTTCESQLVFTKSGGLVFSTNEILGLIRPETHRLSKLSTSDKFTYFISWNNVSRIQVGYMTLFALDYTMPYQIIKWTTPENYQSFQNALKNRSKVLKAENITRLHEIIETTNQIMLEDSIPYAFGTSKKKFLEWMTYFSFGITLLTFLWLIISSLCRKAKKNLQFINTAADIMKENRLKENLHKMESAHRLQTRKRKLSAILGNSKEDPAQLSKIDLPVIEMEEIVPKLKYSNNKTSARDSPVDEFEMCTEMDSSHTTMVINEIPEFKNEQESTKICIKLDQTESLGFPDQSHRNPKISKFQTLPNIPKAIKNGPEKCHHCNKQVVDALEVFE